MKLIYATPLILTAGLLTTGCATKKYVRQTTAPVQAKVDQVGEQTTRQGQMIEESRKQISDVDERATSGINAAQERAKTAEGRAGEAMTRADQANQAAQKNSQEITQLRSSVRESLQQVVANLDDYKLQGEATIPFKFNSHVLSKEAQAELDNLVVDKDKMKRYFIAVEGYTDRSGSEEYNAILSRRRADTVVQYLVAKHEIPIYRIHMVGLGEQKPAEEGRGRAVAARNRRVEVKIFTADAATTLSRLQ